MNPSPHKQGPGVEHTATKGTLRVHIDRIVLDGTGPINAYELKAALQKEFSRLSQQAPHKAPDTRPRQRVHSVVSAPPDASAATWGKQVANIIHGKVFRP